MEVIYVDSLFLLNFVIDYLLLKCTAIVCGLCEKRLRYFSAALIGAAYSVLVYLPRLAFLNALPCKIAAALFMALAAYGCEKSVLRCALVFLTVSAAFGGFVFCITLAGGYPSFDMRTLLLSFALCYLVLCLVFRYKAGRSAKRQVKTELVFLGRSVQFMVLSDSGNELRDPISGDAVMIVCPHALTSLFAEHEELLHMDPVGFMEKASEIPAFKGRIRLIPYSSVGASGMLSAFRPDSAMLNGERRELMVAVSERVWGDGYEGIV